jgi:aminoglycoside phosphotransferase (APT) family kinase protein
MEAEVLRVRETASQVASFHDRAVEAVHGDLSEANVLLTGNGWYVVDWDDLTLGDPAVDFAVLLWPVLWKGGDWRTFLHLENDVAQRLEVCIRAQLLDEIIDPLADYVEADVVPSHAAEVRMAKRRRHEEALERYRTAWG